MIGYVNRKFELNNTGYEDITKRYELGKMNNSASRFANLYAFDKMFIGETIFLYKYI